MSNNHNFHIVNYSPWPILVGVSSLGFFGNMLKMFFLKMTLFNFLFLIFLLVLISYQWWRDIMRESTFQGFHTMNVTSSLKLSMLLFIVSEIFFFISFFWGFFHFNLIEVLELGMKWPSAGIMMFNPFLIPLLNTIILLTSGISVTWAHYSILNNNYNQAFFSLFITIFLGFYFSLLQLYEYKECSFNISDSSFGSIFFILTGFHGIHVMIGTMFLLICFFRIISIHFSSDHHFGFEAASWYWHFVDIVWLFLYILIYWNL